MSNEKSTPAVEPDNVGDGVQSVGRIRTVPEILKAVAELTGMRFVVIAKVTKTEWVACAVLDKMEFGLAAGGELEVATTLCSEVRDHRKPIVIEHASRDDAYYDHPTPKKYGIESYIAVPIVLKNGEFFGTLCAIDSRPAKLSDKSILSSMVLFSELVANELGDESSYAALVESEDKRRESDNRIRAVTDAMPGLISYIDTEYRYQFVNHAYTDWFGLKSEDIIRRPMSEVLGDEAFENLKPHIDSALTGKSEIFETVIPYRLGGDRFIRASYTPDILDGKVRGIFVLVVDISEEKLARDAVNRSEERYRAFIENSTEGIWRFELEEPIPVELPTDEQVRLSYKHGYLAECNDAMARQYGYSSAGDIMGSRLSQLLVEEDPSNIEFLRTFIDSGYTLSEAESHEKDAEGNDRYFLNNFIGIVENGLFLRAWGTQRDVTQARLADDATARLAAIVVSSEDAIISKDLLGSITSWNVGAAKMFGYKAEEIIGKSISLLYPPGHEDEGADILRRIRREENVEHFETVRRRRDGTDIMVSLTVSPIRNAEGNVIGASKIVRDITERKRIEESIHHNQAMLSLAMQSSRMGVWELDLATDTVSWSEELEEIFGLEKGAFLGTEGHFYELMHEDDRDAAWDEVRSAVGQHRAYTIEFRFMHADGSIRWMEGRGEAVYSQKGKPVRLYGVGIDITDRKESEKALRESERRFSRFMQHLPGLAWIKDTEGRYVYANESAERSFGVSGAKLYGKTDEEIFPAETASQFRLHDQRAVESSSGIQILESMLEADGVLHHSIVSKFPITGSDGRTSLIGGMAIDVTDQKRAEDAMRESEEKYRALFDSMDEGYCIIEVIFDKDGRPVDYRFLEVNSAFDRQSGLSNVTGHTMLEFVPTIEDHWLENYGRVARTGEPIRFANEYSSLNKWFDVYAFKPSGSTDSTRIAVLFNDITSRVLAEEQLKESSQFNQDVIDSISSHIAVLDENGEITAVNKAWKEFAVENGADWTMQGIGVGANYLMVCGSLDGLNAEEGLLIHDGIKSVLDGETDDFSVEYPCHSPSAERWFLLTVTPLSRMRGGAVVSHQNITERRLAEEKIRESEARFRNMADHAPVMIWVTEADGMCTYLSESWYEFTGQTEESALGLGWLDAVHPDDAAESERIFREATESRTTFYLEYRLRREDGTYRWAIDSAQPRVSESGEFLGFIGSVIDIDERKAAEDTLRQTQERFEIVKDAAQVGFWFCDLPFDKLIWDSKVKEHFWLPPDADVTIDLFYECLHPDDRGPTRLAIAKSIETKTSYVVEYRTVGPNGEIKWLRAIGRTFYDDQGKPRRFDGVTLDITQVKKDQEALIRAERKAAEEYQELLGRIVPLAATLGRARDLTSIYRSVREFIGASMHCSGFFVSFYDPENSTRVAAYAWGEGQEVDIAELPPMPLSPDGGANSRAVFGKTTVITNNYWDEMKDRPHIVLRENGVDPLSSLTVPMMIKDNVLGTLEVQAHENQAFTSEDAIALEMAANLAAVAIENVRLIETEASAREAAEAANKAKDEFLSVLSHELRTPLNAMLGWVRMLKAGVLDAENSDRALEVIERNTRLQSNLIEDLLDVSRIISGKMRIETELVDLVSIVNTVSEAVQPLADAKSVAYQFSCADESVFLTADGMRLQQVVSNLLQNSIKFTPAGGRIEISLKRSEGDAILSVTDTGVGIEPDLLPHIFDRFRQADASARRNFTGLGLGLTIVRNIVELHGGSIEVKSEGKDKGSTFVLTLPLAADFYKPDLPLERVNPASGGSLAGKSILLVNDDVENLLSLKLFLENQDADVTPAADVSEALRHLAERDFHVMITDIGIREMDSFELVSKLRADTGGRNFALRAIALTPYGSVGDHERALELGFQVHLAKPVNFAELLAAIGKVTSNGK